MVDVREIAASIEGSESIRQLTDRFMAMKPAQAVTVRVMPWLFLEQVGADLFTYFPGPWHGREFVEIPELAAAFWEGIWNSSHEFALGGANTLTMTEVEERFRRYRQVIDHSYRYPFHVALHVNSAFLQPEDIEAVRAIIRDTPRVFATIERRPPVQLQFSAGDRIRSGARIGTFGGFVNDLSGVYGVTCSHVTAASRVDDLTGAQVGTCGPTTSPVALAAGNVCTPFPPAGATAGAVNNRDFALVKMSATVNRSGLTLNAALHQGDAVHVAANGTRYRFQVRSLCIAMRLAFGGANYCFAPLVELYSAAGTTWPGDSGAWGLRNNFSEWATMIAGADSISSFAFDARDVAAWIDGCGAVAAGGWSVH